VLLLLVAAILEVARCQGFRRRRFRGRGNEKQETVDVVDETEEEVGQLGPRQRSRQRALQGQFEDGGRVQRPRGRPNRRRPGSRRRPGQLRGGGRRFPGPRRPLPPVYYDDDYPCDYDYYYYQDDYCYDYFTSESASGTGTGSGIGSGSSFGEDEGPLSGPGDTKEILTQLWEQFLKEKKKTQQKAPEPEYECPPQEDVSYYLPDEDQCDKYFECNIKGELKEKLCPDGFVFDINLEKCDYPVKVNCTGRPTLQEPQPSVNCTRANGFFAWPANISCQNFWDCRNGIAYKQTCPVGVIFDPGLNTCATPDQSTRKECTEGEESFLGFQCPKYSPDSVLRFGNHDRLPHPDDCQQYFTCLVTGGPRLANCGRKKVFNNATGQCSDPKNVPGCETYWIEKLKEEGEEEYYYDDY